MRDRPDFAVASSYARARAMARLRAGDNIVLKRALRCLRSHPNALCAPTFSNKSAGRCCMLRVRLGRRPRHSQADNWDRQLPFCAVRRYAIVRVHWPASTQGSARIRTPGSNAIGPGPPWPSESRTPPGVGPRFRDSGRVFAGSRIHRRGGTPHDLCPLKSPQGGGAIPRCWEGVFSESRTPPAVKARGGGGGVDGK